MEATWMLLSPIRFDGLYLSAAGPTERTLLVGVPLIALNNRQRRQSLDAFKKLNVIWPLS